MMRFGISTAWLVVLLMLSACGSDGLDDLRQFTDGAHKGRKPKVEPMPEVKVHESFAYSAANLSDPFSRANLRPKLARTGGGGGPRPDMSRPKEPLEEYPLDALSMVGTLTRRGRMWGVIRVRAADGTVHRVKVGNHMGRNFGMITKITEEKIELVELIQNAIGDWVEREAVLAITE